MLTMHWSPRSPFVRKVMIVAHELGIADGLTLVRTRAAMAEVNAALSADNPLNKLPTLVLEDGTAIYDSAVICDYLDFERRLHPGDHAARIDALRRQALGDGLLDLLVLWRNERDRPVEKQSPAHMAAWEAKVDQTLDRLEADTAKNRDHPFDIGDIAIGCALGYADFRFAGIGWRSGRPALTAWASTFEARPSALATQAKDG
jgi:glutathione S-transferase